MAKILTTYLNEVVVLQDRIEKESTKILEVIDIDALMLNPEAYMKELGKQFYESNIDEIQEAIKAGEKKAEKIINSIES
tara:strand:- start:452 stop:688 length:237 start_codon:yes stop_codon:yes gene_type:complete